MATWGELEKSGTKWRDLEEMTWGELEEFCVINPKTKQIPDDIEVSFVPMQSVSDTGDVQTDEVRKASEVKKGFTFFEEGDVLFAKITPCMENGKGGIARGLKNGVGFGSTEFHVLHPDPEKVSSEWLYYLTSWDEFRKQCARNMTGSAGQKRVPKSYLEHYKVHLPPLEEQRRIATLLDKVSDLIAKRRAQLDKLDLMVKSRFVEMFEHISDQVLLSDVAEVTGGLTKNSKRKDLPIKLPYLRVANVFFDTIDTNEILEIGLTEEEKRKTLLQNGDLLFVEGNGSPEQIGRVAVWRNEIVPCVHQNHLIKARFNMAKMLPMYAMNYFMTQKGREQIREKAVSTSGLYTLSVSKIESLHIPFAPMDIQLQFINFKEKVDKSKLTIQQSIDKLEMLKKALMQQYFG